MAKKKRRKPVPPPVRSKPQRDSQALKAVKPVADVRRGLIPDFWRGSVDGVRDWARLALLTGGLLTVLFLAFASGGYFFSAGGIAEIFLLYMLVLGLLFNLQVPGKPGRVGWLLFGSFGAFALLNIASMSWSYVPAASLNEFIRALMYLSGILLFYLFLARERWLEWMGSLYVVIAVLVGAWSLAGKALPAVIVYEDIFQHNRLYFPLTYWNALAIFMMMGFPLALRIAADRDSRLVWRGLSLGAMYILMTVLFFTFSRAGYVLMVPILLVQLFCATHRLRLLAAAGLAFFWTAVLIAASFLFLPAMLANAPEMSDKVSQGRLFGVLLLVLGSLAMASVIPFSRLERSIRLSPAAGRKIGYGLSALAVLLVLAAAGAVVAKAGGPVEMARSFMDILSEREASGSIETSQERLLSLQSERYQEYAVSLRVLADNPLVGTGAGTWYVDWQLERPLFYNAVGEPYEVHVRDGHSWILETLAELGLAGGVILLAFIAIFVYMSYRYLRLFGPGHERDVYGAFFAACMALVLHAMVDWDWEMPAVMLPFFMFTGGLLRYGMLYRQTAEEGAGSPEDRAAPGWRRIVNWRLLMGCGCVLVMAVVASVWISERHTRSARTLYSQCEKQTCSQSILVTIRQEAQSARRFNPFNSEALLIEGAAWQMEAVNHLEKGESVEALYDLSKVEKLLLQAIEEEPKNDNYYRKLALVYLGENKIDEAAAAIRKAHDLNALESKETGIVEEMVREAGGKV